MRNAITAFFIVKKVNLDLKSLKLQTVILNKTLPDDQRRFFDNQGRKLNFHETKFRKDALAGNVLNIVCQKWNGSYLNTASTHDSKQIL